MIEQGEGIGAKEAVAPPAPDLMVEYRDEQISLFGVTGTPEELLKLCPVPHKNMTLEAKNMFLAMAMNEAGAGIKAEHLPYFQEITESRNVELKVTVEEVDHQIFGQSNEKPEAVDEALKLTDLRPTAPVQLEPIDESTTEQMDRWLSRLQAEYTQREQARLSTALPTLENSAPEDDESAPAPVIAEDIAPTGVESAQATVIEPKPAGTERPAAEFAPVPTETDAPLVYAELLVSKPAIEKAVSEPLAAPVYEASEKTGFIEGLSAETTEPVELPLIVTESAEEPISEWTATEESVITPLRVVLADLLPQTGDEVVGGQNQNEVESLPLLAQINHFVEMADEPVRQKTEPLVGQVDELTDEIVELAVGTQLEEPAELVKLVQDLELVCDDLLKSLGAEYDEKVLKQVVLQTIQEKASERGVQIPEWLPNLLIEGTREQKTAQLRAWVSDLQVNLPGFHLLGRYILFAVRQANSSL